MSPSPQRGSIDRNAGVNALPIGARVGDYEIGRVIRQGPFSIVYAALDRGSKRKVAVKEYLPAMLADRMSDGSVVVRSLRHQESYRAGLQAFRDEANALSAIDEPALVKVLQSWEQHGTAYMAMRFYEGKTLKEALRDAPRPPEPRLKMLIAPILDALAKLHAARHYPRDVSPDNIIVGDDGSPVLLDYGAARRVIAGMAEDVTVVFKPGFTPIEQYAHDPAMPEGPWTDVYSVAALLCFALTGKPPPTPATRLVADTMKPLGDVVTGYSELFLDGIDRGLAVRPEHRPQDVAAFRTALGIATVTSIDAPRRSPAVNDAPRTIHVDDATAGAHDEPEEGTRVSVLGDGTRPPIGPELVVPPPPPDPQTARRGAVPWKLVVPIVALAVIGLISYVEWKDGRSSKSSPPLADASSSNRQRADAAAPTSAATSAAAQPSTTIAEPVAAPPSRTADASSKASAPAVAGGTMTAPRDADAVRRDDAAAASAAAAAATIAQNNLAATPPAATPPRTGKLQFAIKPWGEIVIDGRSRGLSPPIKEISVPEGKHRIEVRNSTFAGYASEIEVKAGSTVPITHAFSAQ